MKLDVPDSKSYSNEENEKIEKNIRKEQILLQCGDFLEIVKEFRYTIPLSINKTYKYLFDDVQI